MLLETVSSNMNEAFIDRWILVYGFKEVALKNSEKIEPCKEICNISQV